MPKKVLLLGANDRACFSVARNLSQHGYHIEVAHWGLHEIALSRYVKNFYELPGLETNLEGFAKALLELVTRQSFWLVLPTNDLAVEVLNKYKSELEKHVIVGGINVPDTIKYSQNKYELWKLCREIGINVPASQYVDSISGFEDLKAGLNFPLIAKPVSSRKLMGNRIYTFTVRKFSSEQPLEDFVRERIESVSIMLQQVVNGFGIGFNFLSKNGKLIAYYMHERINEPKGGGESSYRKTIPEDRYSIVEKSRQLISHIGWNGVGMIEYKVSDGKAYIMELNGRFWGSIELGIFAGMELPYWQVLHNYENQPLPPEEITTKKEVYARNLRNDLLSAVKEKSPKRILKWVGSIPKMFRSTETVEDSLFSDFRFRLAMWTGLGSKFLSDRKKGLQQKFISLGKTRPAYKSFKKILFICEGNICRSPFAERYLKQLRPDLHTASVGLQFQSGRMSPLLAVKTARAVGIDLAAHRSVYIGDLDPGSYDALFVMDRMNYQKLQKHYPNLRSRIFFLDHDKVIVDPYGGSEADFKACYSRISELLDRYFKLE